MESGNHRIAEAQLVQCMKATHQFALIGNWRTAWPYTMMADPLERRDHAGSAIEAETILGVVKTRDDLKQKIMKGTRDLVSDDEDQHDGDATSTSNKSFKKKKQ